MAVCPLCDFKGLEPTALRCPNCQQAMTDWRNLDHYAQVAHRAGLDALEHGRDGEALAYFVKAAVMCPENPAYLGTYGRMLGRLRRYAEAEAVLRRASQKDPRDKGLAAAAAIAGKLAREAPADVAGDDVNGGDEARPPEHDDASAAAGSSSADTIDADTIDFDAHGLDGDDTESAELAVVNLGDGGEGEETDLDERPAASGLEDSTLEIPAGFHDRSTLIDDDPRPDTGRGAD